MQPEEEDDPPNRRTVSACEKGLARPRRVRSPGWRDMPLRHAAEAPMSDVNSGTGRRTGTRRGLPRSASRDDGPDASLLAMTISKVSAGRVWRQGRRRSRERSPTGSAPARSPSSPERRSRGSRPRAPDSGAASRASHGGKVAGSQLAAAPETPSASPPTAARTPRGATSASSAPRPESTTPPC